MNRRRFLKDGVLGVGASALAGAAAQEAELSAQRVTKWDRVADVVIAGAGASGLCAAIMARDEGASVLVIDQNHDIGGHAMVSGGRIPLGGGTRLQKKFGVEDSADKVYLDHTNARNQELRFSDRDLVRVWADENAPTFDFLLDNGVKFDEVMPTLVNEGTVPRLFRTVPYSDDLNVTINGSPGSGLVRALEKSARAKGVEILLSHRLTRIVRESAASGRVQGITAEFQGKPVAIQARKGFIIATGGFTSNVAFRRMFDPRLTEEYQVAGEPWSRQPAEGEMLAMALGAALWGTSNVASEHGRTITKTRHIGARYGYENLRWNPGSPMFKQAGGSGLTVRTYQDVVCVNQFGRRFWNELDDTYGYLNACVGRQDDSETRGKLNGGGPIWAVFDADGVAREKWDPKPPNVDPNGWFFTAGTVAELARKIANPYQSKPMPPRALEETVAKYNSYVDAGKDPEFGRPGLMFKIQKPPFYAAWATPILHDALAGLRTSARSEVLDIRGQVIPGLYACGESAGGFALHGLPRVTVFGRIAGREAARVRT
ncbi:MAG: FAD-dependent oxidoreductase [Acidobacteria bacterium]|nr:FAD-dependent oxidoreductase [Acidobacteriota bacterium]